ncbi:MAG TPA: YdeI/OmpD-associated family protein [Phycisphaerae bacterium]|nr:YdeI/OmpD-associated family protein [Phycisphaerae bacterium]
MAKRTSTKSAEVATQAAATAELGDSKTASRIRFSATLFRPAATAKAVPHQSASLNWTFLTLPKQASSKLPSRGQTTVEGALNGLPLRATLEPDGQGGHWLKVDRKMREAAGAEAGDVVTLEIAPVAEEPEPKVPADLRKALAAAPTKAREAWSEITPAARRDFIHWITSGKKAETRVKRIETACDMLAKGKRRPCCFDRSGMYSKSMSCPAADHESRDTRRERG